MISLSDNAFSTPGCQQTRDENFSVILNPKAAISIVEKTRSLEGQSDTTFSTPYGCNETGNENLSVILNSKASSFVPEKAWSLEGLNQRSEPYYPKTHQRQMNVLVNRWTHQRVQIVLIPQSVYPF